MRTPARALLAATVALAAACGGPSARDDTLPAAAPSSSDAAPTTTTSPTTPVTTTPDPATTYEVARASVPVPISPAPWALPTHEISASTDFGSPRALLVLARNGQWLQVALPDRPNGSTGWVHADDVEVREIDEHVEIDLVARTLTLVDAGAVVLTTPVAIGTAEAPTPTGAFYVVDKLATGNPDDVYGPFAFGLSAHSDVLTEFAGGDGQVGIHGTNDPASIGQAVSHGCIRVPNEVAQVLDERLHLGTPVTIG
jgi:lipoprotein-anchoring transpeptidase ErfK/SrfK